MSKFFTWIDELGQAEVANKLEVSRQTVFSWRQYRYSPSITGDPSMVQRIIDASDNELTREDIRPDIYGMS